MFSKLATLLQVIGATTITIGVGLIWIPAGVIIGGIFALLFGLALERQK
jgi:hypothetical protein